MASLRTITLVNGSVSSMAAKLGAMRNNDEALRFTSSSRKPTSGWPSESGNDRPWTFSTSVNGLNWISPISILRPYSVATKPVAFEWSRRGTPKKPNSVYAANSATRIAMRMSRAARELHESPYALDLFPGGWGFRPIQCRRSVACWGRCCLTVASRHGQGIRTPSLSNASAAGTKGSVKSPSGRSRAEARWRCSLCANRDSRSIKVWHTGGSSAARIVSFPKGKRRS